MFGIFTKRRTPDEQAALDEAQKLLSERREQIEREKRLYTVLVKDPLDYDSLLRIGKKIGTIRLEIINTDGTIIRYDFKDQRQEITTRSEEEATKGGFW